MGIWLSVMRPLLALSATQLVTVSAAPNWSLPELLESEVTGTTKGGEGRRIEKIVDITTSAMKTMLKFDLPASQSVVTETIVEFLRKSLKHPVLFQSKRLLQ
jgi:hypothetical protein